MIQTRVLGAVIDAKDARAMIDASETNVTRDVSIGQPCSWRVSDLKKTER